MYLMHCVLIVASGILVAVCGFSCPMACGSCSLTRDQSRVPSIGRQIPNHWTTREAPVHLFSDGRDLNVYVLWRKA